MSYNQNTWGTKNGDNFCWEFRFRCKSTMWKIPSCYLTALTEQPKEWSQETGRWGLFTLLKYFTINSPAQVRHWCKSRQETTTRVQSLTTWLPDRNLSKQTFCVNGPSRIPAVRCELIGLSGKECHSKGIRSCGEVNFNGLLDPHCSGWLMVHCSLHLRKYLQSNTLVVGQYS